MIRSFLAIQLPKTILKKIDEIQEDLKSSRADVKWVNSDHIHLTLKFFGNIEESRIDPIVKSIERLIQNRSPFSLKVRGMGAFPHAKNPRVIWMGLADGKEILAGFQRELEMRLQEIGFETEGRPFRPHLTLGRMRSAKGKDELIGRMEKYREGEFGDFQVERIVLFRSDLRPAGPIYTPLRQMMLGTGSFGEGGEYKF
ncbi:MAG: RNA 2',3'-cyclic phosphodiesterase [Syntrophaceae bacterium]|nr:RNA 2',3'-cyclic phosphodiesterase [Syntrophaceae bacterium]